MIHWFQYRCKGFLATENVVSFDPPLPAEQTINIRPCPNNLTANHDLRGLNTQIIQQFWGLIWTQLLKISASIHAPLTLAGVFVGKKLHCLVSSASVMDLVLSFVNWKEFSEDMERTDFLPNISIFHPYFVFTAPCLLHKAPDFLLNPRSPKRSERSDEERKVPDSGNDVWSWTRTSAERAEGKEEKWKILPQWVAMIGWGKNCLKEHRNSVYKNVLVFCSGKCTGSNSQPMLCALSTCAPMFNRVHIVTSLLKLENLWGSVFSRANVSMSRPDQRLSLCSLSRELAGPDLNSRQIYILQCFTELSDLMACSHDQVAAS